MSTLYQIHPLPNPPFTKSTLYQIHPSPGLPSVKLERHVMERHVMERHILEWHTLEWHTLEWYVFEMNVLTTIRWRGTRSRNCYRGIILKGSHDTGTFRMAGSLKGYSLKVSHCMCMGMSHVLSCPCGMVQSMYENDPCMGGPDPLMFKSKNRSLQNVLFHQVKECPIPECSSPMDHSRMFQSYGPLQNVLRLIKYQPVTIPT